MVAGGVEVAQPESMIPALRKSTDPIKEIVRFTGDFGVFFTSNEALY